MSTETLVPAAIEASANLSGAVTDIDEDLSYSPLDFPGLTGWWDANDLSGQGDGTTVTSWADKSGNSRDWGQMGSDNLPTKETVADQVTVHFIEANAQHMENTATLAGLIGDAGLCAIVFQANGTPSTTSATYYSGNGMITDFEGSDGGFWGISVATLSGQPKVTAGVYNGTAANVNRDITVDTPHVALFYTPGDGTEYVSLEGGSEASAATAVPESQTRKVILGRAFDAATDLNGNIYEIVTSASSGTSGDRAALIAYLMSNWSIS